MIPKTYEGVLPRLRERLKKQTGYEIEYFGPLVEAEPIVGEDGKQSFNPARPENFGLLHVVSPPVDGRSKLALKIPFSSQYVNPGGPDLASMFAPMIRKAQETAVNS